MAARATGQVALLSIQPRFAKSIIEGRKTIEFRKAKFSRAVSHVVVYASRPIQRIVCYFEISHTDEGSPQQLWERYGVTGGISLEEFTAYYGSCERGVAIGIARLWTLPTPVPLSVLEGSVPPPQNFVYLECEALETIRKHSCSDPMWSAISQEPVGRGRLGHQPLLGSEEMSDIRKLHDEAMALAEMASVAKLRGDLEQAGKLLRQAYDKESNAAELIAQNVSLEPTRSILFRSAASLAIDCKEFREAERLIAAALAGNPPANIAEELRDLLDQVNKEAMLKMLGEE